MYVLGKRNAVVRGYDALAAQCQKSSLEAPRRITSTNLRKYMATVIQVRCVWDDGNSFLYLALVR